MVLHKIYLVIHKDISDAKFQYCTTLFNQSLVSDLAFSLGSCKKIMVIFVSSQHRDQKEFIYLLHILNYYHKKKEFYIVQSVIIHKLKYKST